MDITLTIPEEYTDRIKDAFKTIGTSTEELSADCSDVDVLNFIKATLRNAIKIRVLQVEKQNARIAADASVSSIDI